MKETKNKPLSSTGVVFLVVLLATSALLAQEIYGASSATKCTYFYS